MNDSNRDLLMLVSRLCIAFLFLWSGLLKLMDPAVFAASMVKEGMPAPMLIAWLAVIIEVGAGVSMILGIKARTVAWLLVPYVIVASLIDHRFWEMTGPAWGLNRVMFGKNIAMLPAFMFVGAIGPGRWSVDSLLGDSSKPAHATS